LEPFYCCQCEVLILLGSCCSKCFWLKRVMFKVVIKSIVVTSDS
jgi:hypothetical protein